MAGNVKAFKHFGVTLKNERWSWSGRNDKGDVVLLLWTDEMNYKTKPPTCSTFDLPSLPAWRDRPGNKERIENLVWARDKNGGKFFVVMAKAKDPNELTRQTDEAYPTKIVMRLTRLNEETGEFSAEVVATTS